MFSRLRTTLDEKYERLYWHHYSGGEHATKHTGDPQEINEIRSRRNLESFDEAQLEQWLFSGGLAVVRSILPHGGAGDAVGYVVADADRENDAVYVHDVFVEEQHRSRGIAGFMVGQLLTRVRVHQRGPVTVSNYGSRLTINKENYQLPGLHLEANREELGADLEKFLSSVPEDWNGIQSVRADDGTSVHNLFIDGTIVSALQRISYGDYRIPGDDTSYEHIAFAAAAVINS